MDAFHSYTKFASVLQHFSSHFSVVFDASSLISYVTRYTEESFSALISLIFIYEAFKVSTLLELVCVLVCAFDCHVRHMCTWTSHFKDACRFCLELSIIS